MLHVFDFLKSVYRFFGMYGLTSSMRISMYRKAGVQIGNVIGFGSHVWLDVLWGKITIEDGVYVNGFVHILAHGTSHNIPKPPP
jgi:hypothetical protein